jgi:hypothetical protein
MVSLLATQQLVITSRQPFNFSAGIHTYPRALFKSSIMLIRPILLLLFGNNVMLSVHQLEEPMLLWRMITIREAVSKYIRVYCLFLLVPTALADVMWTACPFCLVFQNYSWLFDLPTSGTLVFLGYRLCLCGIFVVWQSFTDSAGPA